MLFLFGKFGGAVVFKGILRLAQVVFNCFYYKVSFFYFYFWQFFNFIPGTLYYLAIIIKFEIIYESGLWGWSKILSYITIRIGFRFSDISLNILLSVVSLVNMILNLFVYDLCELGLLLRFQAEAGKLKAIAFLNF